MISNFHGVFGTYSELLHTNLVTFGPLENKLLGVQLCFRRFSPKLEALFLKSDYLFMIESTVRR